MGEQPIDARKRIKVSINELNKDVNKGKVIKYSHKKGLHLMTSELEDDTVVTRRTTDIMTDTAITLINAFKYLTNLN